MNLERFNTLAEAEAFIKGLEYADNIWKQIEGSETKTGIRALMCTWRNSHEERIHIGRRVAAEEDTG